VRTLSWVDMTPWVHTCVWLVLRESTSYFMLSYSYLPFATMGSGSLQALTVIENGFKDDLTKEEAIALVTKAITAGIYHDLGSGSHVDYCCLEDKKTEMFRNAVRNEDLHKISF
jgi:20S proteasome alpha/beta subunit